MGTKEPQGLPNLQCDEGQPACKRCVASRRACVYVQARQHPNEDQASGCTRKALPVLVSKAALHQKEPPGWSLSQAMLFLLVPQFDRWQVATTSYQNQFPPRPHISMFSFHTGFMMMVTSHRIKMISAQRGVAVRRGQGFGIEHLWQNFFGYMALALEHLNEQIVARGPVRYVLHRTIDLLSNELPIMDSLWRSHLKGFFAIVALYGGVDAILETSPRPPYMALNYGMVFAIYGNSCSPAQDQVDGIYFWSEEDIRKLYTHSFFAVSPCPSDIFMAIHRITRLRILVATDPAAVECKSTAAEIAENLHDFPITDWTEPYALPEDPLRPMLAALFRMATLLYALLSLPPHLARPFAGSHWDGDPNNARLYYREALMEMLWQTSKRIQPSMLTWIFAVLGAAYPDGPREEQMLILEQLRVVLSLEDVISGPGTLLELLPEYWASGNLGWEDMYENFLDEAIPENLFFVHAPQCRTRREALSQVHPTESFAEPLPPSTGGAVKVLHRIEHPFAQETVLHREVVIQKDGCIRKSVRIDKSDLTAEKCHLGLLAAVSVPVPQVHGLYYTVEFEHLFMDKVPGETLYDAWHNLSALDRESIADQVVAMAEKWRSLKSSTIQASCLHRRPLKKGLQNATDLNLARLEQFEAATSRPEIAAYVKAMSADLHTAAIVFSHCDLDPSDIMVSGQNLSAMIDFESSGFLPPYFEWVAAKRMAQGAPDGSWWKLLEERLVEGKTAVWDKMWQVEKLFQALEKHSSQALEPDEREMGRINGWSDVCRIVGVDLGEPPAVSYPRALEHPWWLESRRI
ncbi:hypothetical protein PWT90_00618 [Aphanocladium album]|nr:hypothetical protein PWT90_00618 [Aphanocladium album]